MTPFELSVIGPLRDGSTPLYSMYWSVAREFGGLVPIASFLALVDELLSESSVELWQAVDEAGRGRRLSSVPERLEVFYAKVERDRSYDPFDLLLQLGPNAPSGEDPDWELRVDGEARRFVVEGQRGAVPDDMGFALRFLDGRACELRRIEDGETVRVEGEIVPRRAEAFALPEAAAGHDASADIGDPFYWIERWYASHCDGVWEREKGIEIRSLDTPGWSLRFDVGEEAVAWKPVKRDRDEQRDWLHAWLDDGVLNVACGPGALREAVELIREAVTWRTGRI